MRIISKRMLREFWGIHRDTEQPLKSWHAEAKAATWEKPADVKAQYGHASIIGDNRVVFNICGNKYRLITKIHYNRSLIYIRFIGTHEEYDKINAEDV